MMLRWINLLLAVSLGVMGLSALYLGRKPLCISSKVVEKIDRVSPDGVESAWRCSLNREVPYAPILTHLIPRVQSKVIAAEESLWRLRPFQRAIRIVILSDRPWAYRFQNRTLYIGETLVLEREGLIERALAKAWLEDLRPSDGELDLVREVQLDLLQSVLNQTIPSSEFEGEAVWPRVLKSADAYCRSAWKYPEHEEACHLNPSAVGAQAWTASLRPLLSESIIAAWNEQSLKTRVRGLHALPEWLRAKWPDEHAKPTGFMATLLGEINSFSRGASMSASATRENAFISVAAGYLAHLKNAGYEQSEPQLNFDVLILTDQDASGDPAFLEKLASFVETHNKLKIAVKDSKSLWVLPTLQRLPLRDIGGVKADRMAVVRCGKFDFNWVLNFETTTDKLFVIDTCKTTGLDLRSWLSSGAKGFARDNPQIGFVQFHLPSLALRRDSFDGHSDVLETIRKRDVSDPVFQELGWTEVNWFERMGAYRPKAYVDAIEWFRID